MIENTEAHFLELVASWRKNRPSYSSTVVRDYVTHPDYLRIIGMGRPAIPWILREAKRRPDHWFVALSSIVRENPVEAKHAGNLQLMTEDWLKWAERNDIDLEGGVEPEKPKPIEPVDERPRKSSS